MSLSWQGHFPLMGLRLKPLRCRPEWRPASHFMSHLRIILEHKGNCHRQLLVSEMRRLNQGPWSAGGHGAGRRGRWEPGRTPLSTQLVSQPGGRGCCPWMMLRKWLRSERRTSFVRNETNQLLTCVDSFCQTSFVSLVNLLAPGLPEIRRIEFLSMCRNGRLDRPLSPSFFWMRINLFHAGS